ncbi:MAG TPA: hypothetical protein PKA63_07035 [Oligoflexia bacterium]|nr:hypothetical protein [Oligoflexia bacterium]HMP48405.1 hypothetical protein [Oligoflexia bacterium]
MNSFQVKPILLGDSVSQARKFCTSFIAEYIFSFSSKSSTAYNPWKCTDTLKFLINSSEAPHITPGNGLIDLSLLSVPLIRNIGISNHDKLNGLSQLLSESILAYQCDSGGFSTSEKRFLPRKADPSATVFALLAIIELNQDNIKPVESIIRKASDYLRQLIRGQKLNMSDIKLDHVMAALALAQSSISLRDHNLKKEVTNFLQPVLIERSPIKIRQTPSNFPVELKSAMLARIFIDIGLMSSESAFIANACLLANSELPNLLKFTENLKHDVTTWSSRKKVSVPYLSAWTVNLIRLGALLDHPQYIDICGDILRFLTELTNDNLQKNGSSLSEYVTLSGTLCSKTPSSYSLRFFMEACLDAEIIFPRSDSTLDYSALSVENSKISRQGDQAIDNPYSQSKVSGLRIRA